MEPRDPFGELDNGFVQIPAVHVEGRLLGRHRLHYPGMGMADAGNVVVHVDVAAAAGIEQIGALAAHDVQRLAIEQRGAGAERPVAPFDEVSGHVQL